MGRTKQTARKATGGKAPCRNLTTAFSAMHDDADLAAAIAASKSGVGIPPFPSEIGRGKGGKGLGKGSVGKGKPAVSGSADSAPAPASLPSAKAEATDENLSQDKLAHLMDSFAGATKGSPIDIVFSFDTTGSMSTCIELVRRKVRETITRLLKDIPNLQIGIIAHGDYCDGSRALTSQDLSSEAAALCEFVHTVCNTGGGDAPECYELVLREARHLRWRAGSSRALVVIGDEVPHPPSYTTERINWFDELDRLCEMGVKVYGVRALNVTSAIPFYEELCLRSGTVMITFKQFDVIVDMFLAICYREASPAQLEAFREEVQAKGPMSADMRQIFDQLQQPNPERRASEAKESDPKMREPWYNIKLDTGSTQYRWDSSLRTWVRVTLLGASAPRYMSSLSLSTPTPSSAPSTPIKGVRHADDVDDDENDDGEEDEDRAPVAPASKKRGSRGGRAAAPARRRVARLR